MDERIENAGRFELRKIAVQGAISGLFFAQSVSWQQLIDVMVVRAFGVHTDDPWFALCRTLMITLYTSAVAWVVLLISRRCGRTPP